MSRFSSRHLLVLGAAAAAWMGNGAIDPAAVEVPPKWFATGVVLSGAGVVTLATVAFEIPVHFGVLAVLMTFALALVACRTTGESDITPGGAMGKIMQLTYGVLIPQSSTANLMTASITSGASLTLTSISLSRFVTAGGCPGGPYTANQYDTSKPFTPDSSSSRFLAFT